MASSSATTIDWAATGSMLSGVGTIAGVIAVIIAAKIGKESFDQWRRQRIGERKIVIAERIQTLTYRLEEAFEEIRFAISSASENAAAQASLIASGLVNDDTPIELRSRLGIPQITSDRMNARTELWRELAEVLPIARTLFQPAVAEQLTTLRQQRNRIAGAIAGLATIAQQRMRPHREQQSVAMDERQQRYEDVIWQSDPEHDAFADTVKAAVAAIEDLMTPLLREGA